MNDTELRF